MLISNDIPLIKNQLQDQCRKAATAPLGGGIARENYLYVRVIRGETFPRSGGHPAPRGRPLAHRSRFKQSGFAYREASNLNVVPRSDGSHGGAGDREARPVSFRHSGGRGIAAQSFRSSGPLHSEFRMIERTPAGLRPFGDISGAGAHARAPAGSLH
ncbi:hypothetical protein EDC90_103333 [Martelella mediterranea]|uniref:Uncharacterized protein n=1 Tax=Martelella mediterranea TaxID=293089 RepID=A0A4R3NKU1_9HYPH|nr:hypothetical protein EDC90_103333 [Martelella mediterranea]